MSEQSTSRRDRGMTLPELLISIAVIGLVSSVLVAGISVTLRQHEDTRGRIDVARWEQNLGMWLPDDLRSASDANAEPGSTPCGGSSCGGTDMGAGSNVLWLSWNEGGVTTRVSYRYQPDGDGFGLFRVACVGGDCSTLRVLSDLSNPPAGWTPGQPAPTDIIEVGLPVASADPPAPRSVVVSVNGVPAIDGVTRSSRVSVAAGSTPLSTLPPAEFVGPSFVEAASDCGGPITLIVDSSGSIGGQMDAVRAGVEQFIRVFDGTPTRLQIIDFDDRARVLNPFGGPTPWNVYVDMSEPGNADALIAPWARSTQAAGPTGRTRSTGPSSPRAAPHSPRSGTPRPRHRRWWCSSPTVSPPAIGARCAQAPRRRCRRTRPAHCSTPPVTGSARGRGGGPTRCSAAHSSARRASALV
jgi:prepilin-type N-terminal cleavage/methylation domain-containing protein